MVLLSESTCKSVLTDLDYLGLCPMFGVFLDKYSFRPQDELQLLSKEYYCKISFIADFPAQLFTFYCFALPYAGLLKKKTKPPTPE